MAIFNMVYGKNATALQVKSESYTPTESVQTDQITPDVGYDGLNEVNVTVDAISPTYVGSGVPRKTSADLTVSGDTVTAPSGYYTANASASVASGSATTPTTTITANPSISVSSGGLITATASASQSVTPTVSAGYVSSGTAGTVSVSGSNTSQLSTQSATTITPTTSSQTAVAAGKYTTGAVTVAAMPSGTAGTPTATKGTVSSNSVTVTPSVTNTTGYITGGTKTGTGVTVSASELVSGTKSITSNGTGIDVTNYASVDVNVSGGGLIWQDQDGYVHISDQAGGATCILKNITSNGTYLASNDSADGYSVVNVNVSGGATPATPSDVNFFDYDGTIIDSYTKSEFMALSAMPSNPSHTGLTAQGWNWDLANAQAYVGNYGLLNIGQMYITDDGKTRIYITIEEGTNVNRYFYVRYTQSVSNGVTVDWGDGNSQTFTGTTATNRSHQYAASGDYMITLTVTSGTMQIDCTSTNAIYGSTSNSWNRSRIRKVEIGDGITDMNEYAFYRCYSLETITIPNAVTFLGSQSFYECKNLRSITIPKGCLTGATTYEYFNCYSLQSAIISQAAVTMVQDPYNGCCSLKYAIIPAGQTSGASYDLSFDGCNLDKIVIPNNVTGLDWAGINDNGSLKYLQVGSAVTTMTGNHDSSASPALREIHMLPTTPPTASGITLVAYMNLKIYVPYTADHSVLNAYQTAAEWSTISSYIYEEPQ